MDASHTNNFNAIRLLAALAVIVSHSWPAAFGRGSIEPLMNFLGVTLGTIGVYAFFFISGLLITKSINQNSSAVRFAGARIRRIFPALIAMTATTCLILGPLTTTLEIKQYFNSPAVPQYFLRTLTLIDLQPGLPGVFETNPYINTINVSLWTLSYEVICYSALYLAFSINRINIFNLRTSAALFLTLYFAITISVYSGEIHSQSPISKLASLGLPFFLGVVFYYFGSLIRYRHLTTVALALFALLATEYGYIQPLVFFIAYTCYFTGYATKRFLKFSQKSDFSYGVYIYGFPIQQTVAWALPGASQWLIISIAVPSAIAFGAMSWFLVEKPFLPRRLSISAEPTQRRQQQPWHS
jgi:peptidoglycan/LPS O-acetylase OafA/YrhL